MSVIEIVGGAILLVASLVIVFLTLCSTLTVRACPVPSTAVWAVPTMHV